MVTSIHDDDELIAVLAHELGHLNGRHAMRMVLQQSGIAVLVTAVAGDAVGMTLLAAAMPAALLNARYSREFELEADDYAYALLHPARPFSCSRSPMCFAASRTISARPIRMIRCCAISTRIGPRRADSPHRGRAATVRRHFEGKP